MPKANNRKFRKPEFIKIGLITFTLFNLCFLMFNIYLVNNYRNYMGDCRMVNSQRVCTGAYDGLTEEQAVNKARSNGISARIVRRDAETIFRTDDLNRNRLNFSIKNNIVIGTEFY